MPSKQEQFLGRLQDAWRWSYKKLARFRDEQEAALLETTGTHYGEKDDGKTRAVNMLCQAVQIYANYLVGNDPRALVVPRKAELRVFADVLTYRMNRIFDEIGFGDSSMQSVVHGMYSHGVMKVGKSRDGEQYGEGAGNPFSMNVLLQNWCHDMMADCDENIQFMGDIYLVPLEQAQENESYKKKPRESLTATEFAPDRDLSEPTSPQIERSFPDLVEDVVILVDVYMPRSNRFLTLPLEQEWKEPLWDETWDGPDGGPYERLQFIPIPGSTMPLPVVSQWRDLNEVFNELFAKNRNRALALKTVIGVDPDSYDDAQALDQGEDLSFLKMLRPGGLTPITAGGPDQMTTAMMILVKQLFNSVSNNMDALGGLSAQSGTLGQDELLTQNASRFVEGMQKKSTNFMRAVMRKIGWYFWHNQPEPFDYPVNIKGEQVATLPVTAEDREGRFNDYDWTIVPYSAVHRSPNQRLQMLLQLLQQVYLPLAPQFAQQGRALNADALNKIIASYADLPEFNEILEMVPVPDPAQAAAEQPSNPAANVSNRTYTRVNKPGRSQQGADYAMLQSLFKGSQGSEAASAAGM